MPWSGLPLECSFCGSGYEELVEPRGRVAEGWAPSNDHHRCGKAAACDLRGWTFAAGPCHA